MNFEQALNESLIGVIKGTEPLVKGFKEGQVYTIKQGERPEKYVYKGKKGNWHSFKGVGKSVGLSTSIQHGEIKQTWNKLPEDEKKQKAA